MPVPSWVRTVGAVVAVLLVWSLTSGTAAVGGAPDPDGTPAADRVDGPAGPRIFLVGDSFSARYGDAPGEDRAWWSYLREDLDARMTLSVESGSGMLMHGHRCGGTTFGERTTLAALRDAAPDVVVVQGAANDYGRCVDGRRTSVVAEPSVVREGVRAYLGQLARDADAVGVPRDRVYVTAFWGSQDVQDRAVVVEAYRAAAGRFRLTFVDVPALQHRHTLDATTGDGDRLHPNAEGSRFLHEAFVAASALEARVVR